jgi:hypothetical protein
MGEGLDATLTYGQAPSKPMDLAARKSLFYYAQQNSDFFKEDTTVKFVKTCKENLVQRCRSLQEQLHDSLDPLDEKLSKTLGNIATCLPFCVKCFPISHTCKYRSCPWCHARRVHRIAASLLRGLNAEKAIYDSSSLIAEAEETITTSRRVVVAQDTDLLPLSGGPPTVKGKLKSASKAIMVQFERVVKCSASPDKLKLSLDKMFENRRAYTKSGKYDGLIVNTCFSDASDSGCLITMKALEAYVDPALAQQRYVQLKGSKTNVKLVAAPNMFEMMDMLGTTMSYDYSFFQADPDFTINLMRLLHGRRLFVGSGLFSPSKSASDVETEDGSD